MQMNVIRMGQEAYLHHKKNDGDRKQAVNLIHSWRLHNLVSHLLSMQALRIKAVFLLLNGTDRLHHWNHRR